MMATELEHPSWCIVDDCTAAERKGHHAGLVTGIRLDDGGELRVEVYQEPGGPGPMVSVERWKAGAVHFPSTELDLPASTAAELATAILAMIPR